MSKTQRMRGGKSASRGGRFEVLCGTLRQKVTDLDEACLLADELSAVEQITAHVTRRDKSGRSRVYEALPEAGGIVNVST